MKKRFRKIAAFAAAMSLMFGIMPGCSKGGGKTTTLTWYIPGVFQGNYEEIMDKANKLLEEKYGMKLELIVTDFGNYDSKMQVMNASREEYDLCYTSNWCNNYYTNAANGAFYDITELIDKVPSLKDNISDYMWEASKVDGKIYGVPNWQVQAKACAVCMPKEYFDKSGLKRDDIKDITDTTKYLEAVKSINPKANHINVSWTSAMGYYGFLTLIKESVPGAVNYDSTGKPTVVNQYESDSFEEYARLVHSWVDNELAFGEYSPGYNAMAKEVMECPFIFGVYKPGGDKEMEKQYGYPWETIQISPQVLNTDGIIATMTAVSATSKHPEKALELIGIMNSDKELYNLLSWGIEGENYEKTGESTIKLNNENGYSMQNWIFGGIKNSYILDGQDTDMMEKTEEYNNSAIVSPVLGFNPDISGLSVEIANCETVIKERMEMINLGLANPDTALPELREALKVAGADKITEELQKQIDEWWERK